MENENIVNTNTSNGTENDTETVVDVTLDTAAKLQALEEQNRKLFERAKKAEGFVKNAEGRWEKKPAPQTREQPIINNERETPKPSDILRSEEFKLHREGYTEDEIDLIMNNGGRKILENEKSPIALGLKVAREQRRAEEASSQVSSSSGLSDIERKYTKQDLEKMSVKELEQIIPFAN